MGEQDKQPYETLDGQAARLLNKMSEEQKKRMNAAFESLRESLNPSKPIQAVESSLFEAARERAKHQEEREAAEDEHRKRAERYAKIQANSSIIAIIISLIALVVSLFAIFK
jgi:cation transport ATPase